MSPPIVKAASFLLRDSRLSCSVRFVRRPETAPSADVLRLEPGSMVRPLISVLWGGDSLAEPTHRSIGLTRAIWFEGRSSADWQSPGELLTRRSFYGTPDRERPWVLVAPGLRVESTDLEHATGLSNPQLHLLRPRQAARHRQAVYWWPSGKVLASLLGRVDAVVAPNGPLAWDAQRVGAPYFEPAAGEGVPAELANRRLARLVPETLVGDGAFWDGLVAQLLDESWVTQWGTKHWLLLARDRAPVRPGGLRIRRKLRKLRRDPAAFVQDSKWFKLLTSGNTRGATALSGWLGTASPVERPAAEEDHHLFDPSWYLSQLRAPLANGETPLQHYVRIGAAQGLDPHPLFDTRWYLAQLGRPLPKGQTPLDHYVRVGAAQGLSPHPLFDSKRYAEGLGGKSL